MLLLQDAINHGKSVSVSQLCPLQCSFYSQIHSGGNGIFLDILDSHSCSLTTPMKSFFFSVVETKVLRLSPVG